MRIAVQLFGHLRTFRQCAVTLRRHLLDAYPDHDVFLHSWDQVDHTTTTHHAFSAGTTPVDADIRAAIEELYRPAAVRIDRQEPQDEGELAFASGTRMAVTGIRHMLLSMWRANQLREAHTLTTGRTYDVVVATRPDIALHRTLDLGAYLTYAMPPSVPEDETVCTRFCAFGPLPLVVNDLRGTPATDLLFFGRPDVMTRTLRLADEMDRYDLPSVVAPRRPRNLLNTWCQDIGITTALVDFIRPKDFEIIRPPAR